MIKSTFDIDTVAEAVGFWIPGFRVDLAAGLGDTADYRLRCTRNELIEDFDVHVAVLDGAAEVTVAGADGRVSAVRMPVGVDGALGPITGPMVPMALEGIPSGDGTLECTVCMFSGRRSGMAWMHDGIARRTIHDAGGYRLCFDLVGSSLL